MIGVTRSGRKVVRKKFLDEQEEEETTVNTGDDAESKDRTEAEEDCKISSVEDGEKVEQFVFVNNVEGEPIEGTTLIEISEEGQVERMEVVKDDGEMEVLEGGDQVQIM